MLSPYPRSPPAPIRKLHSWFLTNLAATLIALQLNANLSIWKIVDEQATVRTATYF